MMKKHFVLTLSGICAFGGTAEASLLRMQWRGLGPNDAEITMAPGDTAIIDIYFEMNFAEETLASLVFEDEPRFSSPRITQIGTEVAPTGWLDSSTNSALGDGIQQVQWTADSGFHLTGADVFLIGSQTIRLDDMGSGAPIEIAFVRESIELMTVLGTNYFFAPDLAPLAGYYSIGLGYPGEFIFPGPPRTPLIIHPIPEPGNLALLALGTFTMLRRRRERRATRRRGIPASRRTKHVAAWGDTTHRAKPSRRTRIPIVIGATP